MKKTIISILTLALAACIALASCGGNDNDTNTKEENSSAISVEEKSTADSAESSEASDTVSADSSVEESSEVSEVSEDSEASEDSEDSAEETTEDSSQELAVGKTLAFKAKYVKTGIDSSKTQPYAVVIDSDAELTSYYLTNKNACGLGADYKKMIRDYDVNFFEDKALIMVACAENDDTARHEVSKAVLIEYGGNKWLNLEIKHIKGDGTGTQTGWHIIIELDKEFLEAKDNIAVNIVEG